MLVNYYNVTVQPIVNGRPRLCIEDGFLHRFRFEPPDNRGAVQHRLIRLPRNNGPRPYNEQYISDPLRGKARAACGAFRIPPTLLVVADL